MGFFVDLINSVLIQLSQVLATIFSKLANTVFYFEKGIGNVISSADLDRIYLFVNSFAISLLLLKMLTKGFMTYILWRDGDPDAPVQQTVTNYIYALVIAISFPTIYKWYADVSMWFSESILRNTYGTLDLADLLRIVFLPNFGVDIITGIVTLIYFIMVLMLYIQFLKRGLELMILRLGFPLACLGLLDSDNGVFASTVKVFIQITLTTTIQLFLMYLSFAVYSSANRNFNDLIYCIAICSAALAIPRTLQYILLPTESGGGLQKVTSTMHMVSMVKSFIPK